MSVRVQSSEHSIYQYGHLTNYLENFLTKESILFLKWSIWLANEIISPTKTSISSAKDCSIFQVKGLSKSRFINENTWTTKESIFTNFRMQSSLRGIIWSTHESTVPTNENVLPTYKAFYFQAKVFYLFIEQLYHEMKEIYLWTKHLTDSWEPIFFKKKAFYQVWEFTFIWICVTISKEHFIDEKSSGEIEMLVPPLGLEQDITWLESILDHVRPSEANDIGKRPKQVSKVLYQ